MKNQILQGDALAVLRGLPDNHVQTVVTSPPYYHLRDYKIDGQIGMEETPAAYVTALVEVFREVRRVLREDGTAWINLGDSYANDGKWGGSTGGKHVQELHGQSATRGRRDTGLPPKNLIGIPWRTAFALQDDGWILRSDIIHYKPNAMPESVKDRPTKAHEYVFLLAKNERYFYDAEAIREPGTEWAGQAGTFARPGGKATLLEVPGQTSVSHREDRNDRVPTGRNKRSVWSIATTPYPGSHFAVMAPELARTCILAGTSDKACEKCGAPWERMTDTTSELEPGRRTRGLGPKTFDKTVQPTSQSTTLHRIKTSETVGWQPTCACENTGAGKCIVLDPFSGAGTTAYVATKLSRAYLGIELNPEYVELSRRRLEELPLGLWDYPESA